MPKALSLGKSKVKSDYLDGETRTRFHGRGNN